LATTTGLGFHTRGALRSRSTITDERMVMSDSGHARRYCCSIAILAAATAMLAGCAKEPVLGGLGGNAPNPNGCYVFLYDQENWRGQRVGLNGPGKWQRVGRLRGNADKDWRNNIRSIEIGSSATVTVYTELNYRGIAQQF